MTTAMHSPLHPFPSRPLDSAPPEAPPPRPQLGEPGLAHLQPVQGIGAHQHRVLLLPAMQLRGASQGVTSISPRDWLNREGLTSRGRIAETQSENASAV
jgi:hypothetical protein